MDRFQFVGTTQLFSSVQYNITPGQKTRKKDKFGTNTREAKAIINPIGPIKGKKIFPEWEQFWHLINLNFTATTAK